MFRIKICGITSVEDALLAAEAGADAIGLNFYEQSPRYVTPERAHAITWALREKFPSKTPHLIGVFVNASLERVVDVGGAAEIDGIQLHGDEPPELIAELNMLNILKLRDVLPWWAKLFVSNAPLFTIVRAFRCEEPSLLAISDYLAACLKLTEAVKPDVPQLPQAILLDAFQPGRHGGTGCVLDWNVIPEERDMLMGLPLILAGGLTPENVAEAIATARPDAVDVASGVESAPGRKDPAKVRAFVAAAKKAFAALDR